MQIRYRITLAYTIIVTIILLLLGAVIYFFSAHNRSLQFQNRLAHKANNTADLLLFHNLSAQQIIEVNSTSTNYLFQKAISIFDEQYHLIFHYEDKNSNNIAFPLSVLSKPDDRPYFFKVGVRDAVVLAKMKGGKKYIVTAIAFDSERYSFLSKLRIILVISFFLGVGFVILSGYAFSLRLVTSISNISHKVKHISSEAFTDRLTTGNENDELQELTTTINNLLDRLQLSFETQRRFIDNASHELSTPLASIGNQIDVVMQRERNADDYKKTLLSVHEDVHRLSTLVKSLLEVAKVSGVKEGLELLPIRIDEVLMEIPAEMKKINPAYEVKLLFDEMPDDEDMLTVMGKEILLNVAFKNIIHNACKYSNDKTATVLLKANEGNVIVSIKDNGAGIAAHEHERIFQPFYRSSDINNRIAGTGIGLSLANHIVQLYKGTIALQSELGEGSIFTISLPIAQPV